MGVLVLAGCRKATPEPADSPNFGSIVVAADESFRPLVDAEAQVFMALYPGTHLETRYMAEDAAIRELLDGTARLAVVARAWSIGEAEELQAQQITPRAVTIAKDAVAIILHPSNPDSMLTMEDLRRVVEGQLVRWSDVSDLNGAGDIALVFDQDRSSNLNFILSKFGLSSLEGVRVYATRSNAEVIDYVASHPEALGIIGAAWISDLDDPGQQAFISQVRVAALSTGSDGQSGGWYKPYQDHLALDRYPLVRDVVILSREARIGLGTGFIAHVASERGQRIILKSGLLPVTMPERDIVTKDTF